MTIKQLSVFVENRPGTLAGITAALEGAGVDIRALSIADTANFGILRLIVDDPDAAHEALLAADYTANLTEVIGVGVPDEPGGLSKALGVLGRAGIMVEYIYAFLGSRGDNLAYVIIRVADCDGAIEAFRKAGVRLLEPEEVYHM